MSAPALATSPPPGSEGPHVWAPRGETKSFLFEQRQSRLGGAVGVSFLSHIAAFGLAIYAMTYAPKAAENMTPFLPSLDTVKFVFLPAPGAGGGGGGGGNMSKEPVRKLEAPGKDKLSVPAVQPKAIVPVEQPKDDPPLTQELVLPVKTMSLGTEVLTGAFVGVDANASNSQGTGQGGGAGTGRGTGIGPGDGPGFGPGSGGGMGGGPMRSGGGVTPPRVLREFKPNYTGDAMRAKVQGSVWLEAIVLPDGTVGSVEVIKSLDPVFGLDQEALKAARKWQFIPGTFKGQPVPVIVTIELTFTLR